MESLLFFILGIFYGKAYMSNLSPEEIHTLMVNTVHSYVPVVQALCLIIMITGSIHLAHGLRDEDGIRVATGCSGVLMSTAILIVATIMLFTIK